MSDPRIARHDAPWHPAARWAGVACSGLLAIGLLGIGAYLLVGHLSGPVMDADPAIGPMGFLFGVAGALLGPTMLGICELLAAVLSATGRRIGQMVAGCAVLGYVAVLGPWAGVLVFYSSGSAGGDATTPPIVVALMAAVAVAAVHLALYIPKDRRGPARP